MINGLRIGCCITPHGLGHAARACAVMEVLADLLPVHFEIVTTVPDWFFKESLAVASYTLHPIACDIGLVQQDSLQADLDQTLVRLDRFYPLSRELTGQVATLFRDCQLVLADIAPLGIVAAKQAGIPSVLLENFTWDWIYQPYVNERPGFKAHIDYLQQVYAGADYHIQAEPVCQSGKADLLTLPIARPRRQPGSAIREQLQLTASDTVILITMGGVSEGAELPLEQLAALKDEYCFILSGQEVAAMEVRNNLRLLPPDSGIYHPDLVAACDAVVGKVGYSTLAEVYWPDIPFAYVCRSGFRESEPLARFIRENMLSLKISEQQFRDHSWLSVLPRLLQLRQGKRSERSGRNGAETAARFLANLLQPIQP